MKKQITMSKWEKSAMDKRMDAMNNLKEGSKAEQTADKKALKTYNTKNNKAK